MVSVLREDFRAVARNDPAARSAAETLLFNAPLHAIWLHRVAHWLHQQRVPLLPGLLALLARVWSGVEIHPGARIGPALFIDHGTGVVIGETAEIGRNCVMFHNVTLGGTGKHRGKRHPTVEDGVLIGTGAVLLGPIRVGANAKIGANSFIIMRDVPPGATVVGTPARIVKLDGAPSDRELEPTRLPEESIPVSRPGAEVRAPGRARRA